MNVNVNSNSKGATMSNKPKKISKAEIKRILSQDTPSGQDIGRLNLLLKIAPFTTYGSKARELADSIDDGVIEGLTSGLWNQELINDREEKLVLYNYLSLAETIADAAEASEKLITLAANNLTLLTRVIGGILAVEIGNLEAVTNFPAAFGPKELERIQAEAEAQSVTVAEYLRSKGDRTRALQYEVNGAAIVRREDVLDESGNFPSVGTPSAEKAGGIPFYADGREDFYRSMLEDVKIAFSSVSCMAHLCDTIAKKTKWGLDFLTDFPEGAIEELQESYNGNIGLFDGIVMDSDELSTDDKRKIFHGIFSLFDMETLKPSEQEINQITPILKKAGGLRPSEEPSIDPRIAFKHALRELRNLVSDRIKSEGREAKS